MLTPPAFEGATVKVYLQWYEKKKKKTVLAVFVQRSQNNMAGRLKRHWSTRNKRPNMAIYLSLSVCLHTYLLYFYPPFYPMRSKNNVLCFYLDILSMCYSAAPPPWCVRHWPKATYLDYCTGEIWTEKVLICSSLSYLLCKFTSEEVSFWKEIG